MLSEFFFRFWAISAEAVEMKIKRNELITYTISPINNNKNSLENKF